MNVRTVKKAQMSRYSGTEPIYKVRTSRLVIHERTIINSVSPALPYIIGRNIKTKPTISSYTNEKVVKKIFYSSYVNGTV